MSIRGTMPDGLTPQLTLSFNPWSEKSWIKSRFFDVKSPQIFTSTTTYKCNEWLTQEDLFTFQEMEKNNPRRYQIEGLGEWGISEGLIYNNFEVQEFDYKTILRDRNCFATYGLDFGFTDPTAFVAIIVNQKENILYIFKEWYQTNVTNDDIARALKDLGLKGEKVYCDSAEPKSIAELRKLNINALAVAKGADSVRYGIQKIQNYKIIIHPECEEFYHEISNYIWKKDRNGNTTNVPEHEFSHCLTGDTLVMTTEGEKPIKELVNKQGNVYCFNEKTKQKTISNFFDCRLTRKNAPLLKITLADGKEIKLTPDHLILTKNGWKKAEELTLNDEVLKI